MWLVPWQSFRRFAVSLPFVFPLSFARTSFLSFTRPAHCRLRPLPSYIAESLGLVSRRPRLIGISAEGSTARRFRLSGSGAPVSPAGVKWQQFVGRIGGPDPGLGSEVPCFWRPVRRPAPAPLPPSAAGRPPSRSVGSRIDADCRWGQSDVRVSAAPDGRPGKKRARRRR